FPLQESKFTGALSSIFSTVLEARYPSHPDLRKILKEKSLRELTRGFYYLSEWARPELKSYLEHFALPLHLIKRQGDHYEYTRRADLPDDSPYKKLLQLLDEAGDQGIERLQVETVLRAEPFGLQLPMQLLLIIGATAAGQVFLVDQSGEIILTSAGIRSGYDVANYSRICSAVVDQGAVTAQPSDREQYERV